MKSLQLRAGFAFLAPFAKLETFFEIMRKLILKLTLSKLNKLS